MVCIQKFRIIVLVLNRIKYLSNYWIRNFEYSHSTNTQYYWVAGNHVRPQHWAKTPPGVQKKRTFSGNKKIFPQAKWACRNLAL